MTHLGNKASFDPHPHAEVIESSLYGFLAQSWRWDQPPTFGSLVTVEGKKRTIFGIVQQIQTGSSDSQRQAFAYQKTHEELLREQPQIFELLKTSFSCLTLGYQEKGRITYQLAPEPPLIHSFVGPASPELARQFFAHESYLHLLFGQAGQMGNLDELLLAIMVQHKQLGILSPERINKIMQIFSVLTANDYRRLKLFLQRVEPLCNP
ncbi:HAS-barrel domain-containing protein [Methylicorpusculum sp.]|uniref:HAS-barrel domain-containing protein n=1 Tax=Methylicorpusculum sp. TaxID=2713644 RepID=UPI002ABA8307|nr:HAS-barrel domain-containing protein [Methylicorpusculum sp.]MDZ4151763.1 hypothetical protein [Methylicorpusculum sp.]